MKKNVLLISLLCLGASVAVTSGCSSKPKLKVYNWGEYIDTNLLKEFEREYNCKVKYSTFNSNEAAITQMKNNTFDIVVPSDYAVEELVEENMLQELDWNLIYSLYAKNEELPASDNGLEAMKGQYTDYINDVLGLYNKSDKHFDFLKYAAPYFSGNVGIVFNADKVNRADVEAKGYDIFKESGYKIAYYDSSRDGFMAPLKKLGYSMNTSNEAEINQAYDWLVDQKAKVGSNLSYVTDEVLDGMINGDFDMALVYSGDAVYTMSESDLNLDFYVPSEGTNVWVDGMVIPKGSEQVELAHKFIAFMTRPESGYANSYEVCYNPSTKKALEMFLNDEDYKDYAEFYNYEIQEKDEIYRYNKKTKEMLDRKWHDAMNAKIESK